MLPTKVFKYRSCINIDRIIDIIENHRLFLSKRENLNDPFEG